MPRLTAKNPPAAPAPKNPKTLSKAHAAAAAKDKPSVPVKIVVKDEPSSGDTAEATLRSGSEGEPSHEKIASARAAKLAADHGAQVAQNIIERLDALDRRISSLAVEIARLHDVLRTTAAPPPLAHGAPEVVQLPLPTMAPSIEVLKERVTALLTGGQRQKVIDALTSLGVKKATDLSEGDRQRFLDLLK